MLEQTLHCKAGHSWTRPIARGPKPQWCPDHHPGQASPGSGRKDMAELRDAKAQKAKTREQSTIDEVEAILADSMVNEELRRKLAYCQRELAREREGHAFLITRRAELLREARRTLRTGF